MATVLIVDDDKHMRALIERMFRRSAALRPYHLKIVQAADGEEGLTALDVSRPDVVVCDLLMPRMDGWQFCRGLRQRAHGKDVGLAVISGLHREKGVARQIREEFGGLFFAKPNELGELVGAVEKLLAARTPESARPTRPATPPTPPRTQLLPMEGKLAEKNLPTLLLELYEGTATGVLELRRGRLEKRVELLDGHPLTITSNQRNETLGQFLVEKRAITKEQHQQALARAVGSGARLGKVLVELGALSAAKLVNFLQLQARHRITQALRWKDGAWQYRPTTDLLDRANAQPLDGPSVVFGGLRESAVVEEAAAACDALEGRKVALTERGQKLLGAFARTFGDGLSRDLAAAGGATVEELLARHHEVSRVLTAVEALLLTGCGEPTGRFPTGPVPPKKRPTVDPIALDRLSAEARGAPQSPELFDVLFGDEPRATQPPPAPLLFIDEEGVPVTDIDEDESGVIDLTEEYDAAQDVRDELLLEFLRIQGMDWYGVLTVARTADAASVEAAYAERTDTFSLERYRSVDLGRDYGKLEELHVAYRRAREILTDRDKRRLYDAQMAGTVPPGGRAREAIDAELCFHEGEELLAKGRLDEAIESYRTAVQARPDAADYHAALGFALHKRGRREASAHLAQALTIDPDHPAAHSFTGQVLSQLGDDSERALGHLERALDAQPPRFDALATLVALREKRGETRELERVYRKLIHRVGSDREQALKLWVALARLYRELGDRDGARVAYQAASRLAPRDETILAALDELTAGDPGHFSERAEALRSRFRLDKGSAEPVREMLRSAAQAGQPDAAFVAAAVLVARDLAAPEQRALYEKKHPRALPRPRGGLDDAAWARVRHADDDPDLGALFALLEPLAAEVSPISLASLGVGGDQHVPRDRVPEPLQGVRTYAAKLLAVREPEIYVHRDFAEQVHIGALDPPVLLVGPQALEQTDRVELAFWVGRAMTYVRAGRCVGGSRPGRVLRALLSACIADSIPGSTMPDPSGMIGRGREYLAGAPEEYRELVRDLVARVTYGRTGLNLSTWARALARTADRIGLLACADPAVAARSAGGLVTDEALADLIDFSLSTDHLAVRQALGVAMDD